MNRLRHAAARERRIPMIWWGLLFLCTGGSLVAMAFHHSPYLAIWLALLLVVVWSLPLLVWASLSAPRRSRCDVPLPGHGSFSDWMHQTRILGRVLLYHEDNPELMRALRLTFREAREDLRDTLGAHPLRDDLERVCQRLREGAIREMKDWFWHEYGSRVRDIQRGYEQAMDEGMDEDERLVALQAAVVDAAALMTCRCMPRMLDRERLVCARDCAWLASQMLNGEDPSLSPIELAGALVVEWTDFSEPWLPAQVFHRAVARIKKAREVPPAEGGEAQDNSEDHPHRKFRRIRVRVRKTRRHSHHRSHGPTLVDIFLSFGQWVRYSVRAWLLYR